MEHFLASRPCGAIYNLRQRVEQYRAGLPGSHPDRASAFLRERQIKDWQPSWKIRLIQSVNPDWRDVAGDIPH